MSLEQSEFRHKLTFSCGPMSNFTYVLGRVASRYISRACFAREIMAWRLKVNLKNSFKLERCFSEQLKNF